MITKDGIKQLYHSLCKHQEEYKEENSTEWNWHACKDCVLRNTAFQEFPKATKRDVCFAIWHEGVLDGRIDNDRS